MKHVVMTGVGSGIGKATAARLVGSGYQVWGGVISEAEGNGLRAQLGARFTPLVLDVRDPHAVSDAADQVSRTLGSMRITALLNIAGIIVSGPLVDLSPRDFGDVLAVNLVGMHTVTKAFLPLLASNSKLGSTAGRIVNMSSQSGRRTMPFSAAYSASKFGVEALSSAMRMEFAPMGIEVVVIAPGLINTPMAEKIRNDLQKPPSLPFYAEPLRRFLAKTIEATEKGVSLTRVVDIIVRAIEVRRPRYRYELHNNFFRDAILMRALPARQRDAIVARLLALQHRRGTP